MGNDYQFFLVAVCITYNELCIKFSRFLDGQIFFIDISKKMLEKFKI
jgi:hypothetical protein